MALTMRQQMTKGSKWRVKVAFSAENHSASKWEIRSVPGSKYREFVQTHKQMVDFAVGDILTVTDKSSTYYPHYISGDEVPTGVFIPISRDNKHGQFLIKDIQDHLELVEAVEQLIYVFHSPSLGYIVKIPWGDWRQEDRDALAEAEKTGGILFTDKLTKAMKKKRSQDTKMWLLSHSGYFDDIDTSDIYYVFEPGGKTVEFPDDLEVLTIDKATKNVKEKFLAKDYLAEAFRLRPLTLKYGGPVRNVFKDMEEKGKDFSTLLMFQDTNPNIYNGDKSEKVALLKDEFKAQKLDKGSYIMKSDHRTVAFAFKNRNDALMFRLQYTGDLQAKLVDAETLDEVKSA